MLIAHTVPSTFHSACASGDVRQSWSLRRSIYLIFYSLRPDLAPLAHTPRGKDRKSKPEKSPREIEKSLPYLGTVISGKPKSSPLLIYTENKLLVSVIDVGVTRDWAISQSLLTIRVVVGRLGKKRE